ncbi:hypothetical protein BL254_09880 [Protofrankia sp. BMG5.30]|nr:AMP-binding protein [Protofrankia sp. BMG5.30]ONH35609.1 hypothetical protein BL254_09880 [Protofrankia sp. BMG5.30]
MSSSPTSTSTQPGSRISQPHISRRPHWNNHLERHADAIPEKAALRFDGTTTTWAQLRERVHALADAFARRGIGFGDRVAIVMGNRPEFLETVLVTNRLGPSRCRSTSAPGGWFRDGGGRSRTFEPWHALTRPSHEWCGVLRQR